MRASLAQRYATRAMPGFSTFFPKTFPKDRPLILNQLGQVQKAANDDEVQKNLAAFADALAAAK